MKGLTIIHSQVGPVKRQEEEVDANRVRKSSAGIYKCRIALWARPSLYIYFSLKGLIHGTEQEMQGCFYWNRHYGRSIAGTLFLLAMTRFLCNRTQRKRKKACLVGRAAESVADAKD